MKRFAFIGTAVMLTVLGVLAIGGQEKSKIPPEFENADEREPRRDAGELLAKKGKRSASFATEEFLNVPNPTPNYIVSQDIVVSVSEKGDAVWGFSKTIGKWTKQEIRPASKDVLVPTLTTGVASLHVGQTIYAYSGRTGRWDILRVASGRKPQISVDTDMILVTDGQIIYTFADATGRWSSTDDPTPETSTKANREHLDHLAQTLQQLEQSSVDLARKFRHLKSVENTEQRQLSKLKGQIRKTVSSAFQARQELQQAELEELRLRLVRIQKLIEKRERIEGKIVDRRVEELLNRELSWDGTDAE